MRPPLYILFNTTLLYTSFVYVTFEDKKETRLNQGDYLNISAHTKHRVSWTSQHTETIWLAIYYSDQPL